MRIADILNEEDVKSEIVNNLMDIITTYRQKEQLKLPIQGSSGVINYLRNLGHDISIPELMSTLASKPFDEIVERTTPDYIYVKSNKPQQPISKSKEEKSSDHVKKVASKAANKAVKSGDKIA